MIDIRSAFENGNKGLSIWVTDQGYQVSVKRSDGAFSVHISADLDAAMGAAMGAAFGEKDDFEDIL